MEKKRQPGFFQLFCPICKKSVSWNDNPFRPFCNDRCKLIDLGQWAQEGYRIASDPVDETKGQSDELDDDS